MSTKFEEYFSSLKDKKIAVLGLGVSNRPLVRLLLQFGCDVVGCDKTPREKLDGEVLELERLGCKLRVGEGYLDGNRQPYRAKEIAHVVPRNSLHNTNYGFPLLLPTPHTAEQVLAPRHPTRNYSRYREYELPI